MGREQFEEQSIPVEYGEGIYSRGKSGANRMRAEVTELELKWQHKTLKIKGKFLNRILEKRKLYKGTLG